MTQNIMRKPFNMETHKVTFVNYLEVVITEDGTIEYAVPSHQEKVIAVACEKLDITRKELEDLCPKEYYWDYMTWLCKISSCVSVWNEWIIGTPNELQQKALEQLAEHGLYRGKL